VGKVLLPLLAFLCPFSHTHLERAVDERARGRVRARLDSRSSHIIPARAGGRHQVDDQGLGRGQEGRSGGRGGRGRRRRRDVGQQLDGGQAGLGRGFRHGHARGRDAQKSEGAGRGGHGRRVGGKGVALRVGCKRATRPGLVEEDDGVLGGRAGQQGGHRLPGGRQRPFRGGGRDVKRVGELWHLVWWWDGEDGRGERDEKSGSMVPAAAHACTAREVYCLPLGSGWRGGLASRVLTVNRCSCQE
jgi:hypothetical protein